MSNIKLVLAVVAAIVIIVVSAWPAFAQDQNSDCFGTGISEKTLQDIESGEPSGGGQFASQTAQESDFGGTVSGAATASSCP